MVSLKLSLKAKLPRLLIILPCRDLIIGFRLWKKIVNSPALQSIIPLQKQHISPRLGGVRRHGCWITQACAVGCDVGLRGLAWKIRSGCKRQEPACYRQHRTPPARGKDRILLGQAQARGGDRPARSPLPLAPRQDGGMAWQALGEPLMPRLPHGEEVRGQAGAQCAGSQRPRGSHREVGEPQPGPGGGWGPQPSPGQCVRRAAVVDLATRQRSSALGLMGRFCNSHLFQDRLGEGAHHPSGDGCRQGRPLLAVPQVDGRGQSTFKARQARPPSPASRPFPLARAAISFGLFDRSSLRLVPDWPKRHPSRGLSLNSAAGPGLKGVCPGSGGPRALPLCFEPLFSDAPWLRAAAGPGPGMAGLGPRD